MTLGEARRGRPQPSLLIACRCKKRLAGFCLESKIKNTNTFKVVPVMHFSARSGAKKKHFWNDFSEHRAKFESVCFMQTPPNHYNYSVWRHRLLVHHDVRTAGDENPYVISTMRPNWSARGGCIFDENPCAFLLVLAPRARTPTSKCLTLGGLSG